MGSLEDSNALVVGRLKKQMVKSVSTRLKAVTVLTGEFAKVERPLLAFPVKIAPGLR